MNEQQQQLLAEAQVFVTELFRTKVDPKFIFHNIQHTRQVAAAADEMAAYYHIKEEDHLVLLLSAWFHDTGFSSGQAEEHEKESIRLATEFLQQHTTPAEIIQRVSSCINATRMPQSPISQIEKILCDADLYHLGTQDFKRMSERLMAEQEAYFKKPLSKKEWRQRNIEFLTSHQYFTDYCQQKQEPQKQEWIKQLTKKQGGKAIKHTEQLDISPYSFSTESEGPKEGKSKSAGDKEAERGIQTIFRTTSHNHVQLSSMADSKANIMISVNSIILSVMFSVGLLGRLQYYKNLIAPTLILITVCVLAITYAILSVRPSISSGTFTEDDIRNKRTNLLFFGNFHRMELKEYQWGMNEMLKDREYIYDSMIKDIYFLGVVLARKYHYLRLSYSIFMYGLILSVVAFAVSALFFE